MKISIRQWNIKKSSSQPTRKNCPVKQVNVFFFFFFTLSSGIQQLSQDICSQHPRLCLHPMDEFHSQLRSEGAVQWLATRARAQNMKAELWKFSQTLSSLFRLSPTSASNQWQRRLLFFCYTTQAYIYMNEHTYKCKFKCVHIQLCPLAAAWRAIFMTSNTLFQCCGQRKGHMATIWTCDSLFRCMKVHPNSSSLRLYTEWKG